MLDGVQEGGKDDDGFDTDAAIITGELSALIPDLLEALGGEIGSDARWNRRLRSHLTASGTLNFAQSVLTQQDVHSPALLIAALAITAGAPGGGRIATQTARSRRASRVDAGQATRRPGAGGTPAKHFRAPG